MASASLFAGGGDVPTSVVADPRHGMHRPYGAPSPAIGQMSPAPAIGHRNLTVDDSTIATYETYHHIGAYAAALQGQHLRPPPLPPVPSGALPLALPPAAGCPTMETLTLEPNATYATLGTAELVERRHQYRPLRAAPTMATAPTVASRATKTTRRTAAVAATVEAERERQQLLRVRRPPCKFVKRASLPSKLAIPIKNRTKVPPGRLFLRMPLTGDEEEEGLAFRLGEYSIGFRLTDIDTQIVERARKKVEKRAAKTLKTHGAVDPRVYGAGDGANKARSVLGSGVLEQRDDVETSVANARKMEAVQRKEATEMPKLASLCIEHTSPATGTTKTVWSSAPGINFVSAAALAELEVQAHGRMAEHFVRTYTIQTVDSVLRGPANVVTIVGQLGHAIVDGHLPDDSPWYALSFESLEESRALRFALQVEGGANADGYDGTANMVQMSSLTNDLEGEREAFFGLGARMSSPDLRGQEVHVCHPAGHSGAGRHSPNNASGHATLPHVVSSHGVSLHLHNAEPSAFDFTPSNWYAIRTPCSQMSGTFLAGDSLLHALELHTAMTGRASLLPGWTQRGGALAGVGGGTAAVQRTCRNLFKFRVPLAGVLVGDWTGPKSASNASAAGNNPSWYNYVLEREHYTGWGQLVDALERRGINVGVHLAPCLEEIPQCLRSGRRYLFGEAGADCFVKERASAMDEEGQPAPTSATGPAMYNHFKRTQCGTLDVTNRNAAAWFKGAIKEEVLDRASASFWLADATTGGPPMEGAYSRHPNVGLGYHNAYAEDWARLNREAIREAGRDGDCFFVANGAYGATAKHAGCTALPDRSASFGHDGGETLRSILNGILNGGFSGLTLTHCAVGMVVPRRLKSAVGNTIDAKSREMICRWMEMTAFTTLFRTHDSQVGAGDASPGGTGKGVGGGTISAYDDEGVMKAMARWTKVYLALADYRTSVLNEASFKGYPAVRHPLLHFPLDENFRGSAKKNGASSPAFMLGESIYVVPVLKSGVAKKRVHLPAGDWTHLWSMEEVAGPHSIGKIVEVSCLPGEPPVFVRNTDAMHQFMEVLKQKRVIDLKRHGRGGKPRLFSSFRRR